MRVQLTWTDPNTQQVRSPTLEPPIAFGREFSEMPSALKGIAVRRMVLAGDQVAPFHAIIAEHKGHLVISDRQGGTKTFVNGTVDSIQRVNNGDTITIGPFEIVVALLTSPSATQPPTSQASQPDPFAVPIATDPFANSVPVQPPAIAANASNAAGMAMGFANSSSKSNSQSHQMDDGSSGPSWFDADGKCAHKVGFLFKRRCDRTTTEGCRDCQNGQIDPGQSRYQDDYAYYPGYGRYDRGRWGHDYYHQRDHYHYDPHSRRVDFNESDAASFEQEGDQDYEMDLDAS